MQLYSSHIIGLSGWQMAVTTTLEQNFDRKLDIVTAGLTKEHSDLLEKIPRESALTVMDYIISLIAKVNPSANYRKDILCHHLILLSCLLLHSRIK
jgi:hypothetical protein